MTSNSNRYNLDSRASQQGIALFMVISAISILSIIVSEFMYISQVGTQIAYGRLDELQAFYTAKSGLKLALLRLRAYNQVINNPFVKQASIPVGVLNQLWSMPIMLPMQSALFSELLTVEKNVIDKFNDEIHLPGELTMNIASLSNKINLNTVIAAMQSPPKPSGDASSQTNPSTSPTSFDKLRLLRIALEDIMRKSIEGDEEKNSIIREVNLDALAEQILIYADSSYNSNSSDFKKAPPKKAPFYSMSELFYIPEIQKRLELDLYDIINQNFMVRISNKNSLSINTMTSTLLRYLFPELALQEAQKIIDLRNNPPPGASPGFQSPDALYEQIKNIGRAYSSQDKDKLAAFLKTDKGIDLTNEEDYFQINIEAKVNESVKKIKAWVQISDATSSTQLKTNYMKIE